ncbi:MAG: hypothetical protein ACREBF_05050 [Candidatus Micrarchaeales archaeon]
MDTIEFLEENSKYLIYAAFAIMLLLSIALSSATALIVSACVFLAAIAYSKSSHIINPILAKKSGIVLVSEGYRLSENTKVAVKGGSPNYSAVSIALLTPNSKVTNGSEKFEDILSKCRYPFEFCIHVAETDIKKVVDNLQTKRRIKEIELSKTPDAKPDSSNKLRREIAIIEGELFEITKGQRPTAVLLKLRSRARGRSEGEAANAALSQIEKLCNMFSATYNLGCAILSGEELLQNIVD